MYEQLCRHAKIPITIWTNVVAARSTNTYVTKYVPLLAESGWPRWRNTLLSLRQELKQDRTPRTIVVGQILPLGIPVWILSFFYPVRYAIIVHGMDLVAPTHSWRKKWMVKRILRRAHVILAANKNIGFFAKKIARTRPVEIVYPSPYMIPTNEPGTREALRSAYDIRNSDLVFLTIGRLVARKGHRDSLAAFARIHEAFPGSRYVILGDGPEKEALQALTKDLHIADRVEFISHANDDLAKQWLEAADMFVMTPVALPGGDIEGLGIVYLEAAAFGLPTIGTKTGGVVEAIENGSTGLLVDEHNVDDIARAMRRLAENAALRKAFGNQGKRFVQTHFSPEEMAQRFIRACL